MIKVSEEFFIGVYWLIDTLENSDNPEIQAICERLKPELNVKMEARNRRESFTAYKKAAPGTANREQARQKYLDSAGIHKNWRSSEEKQI